MEYTTLGETGVRVSEICLGGASLGFDSSDKHEWSIGERESTEIVERAIDLGVNFFDTSNSYNWGDSERLLGSVLAEYDRDELVVATKVYNAPSADPHPNATGLSRKTIEQELAASRDRLGMETIDLYQIHRWDYDTPIEETLSALDDAVRRGAVRYLGASSMWAHQFADALHEGDRRGLDRFATMQNHYNLAYREEEREMLPLCRNEGVGVIPYSPLAKGFLARPREEIGATTRGDQEGYWEELPYERGGGVEIAERVEELAAERDVSMAQIALAWLLHRDEVDAPIVGTTSVEHLEEAVEALDISLSDSDLEHLEEPYEPVPVYGHE